MLISLVDSSIKVSVRALSTHLHNHRNTKQLMVLLRVGLIAIADLTLPGRERERGRERFHKDWKFHV